MAAEPPLVQDRTPGLYKIALATDYEQSALDTLQVNFPRTANALLDDGASPAR
jgi:hypothetical protein